MHGHGFDSEADLSRVTLGKGIEIFTVPPEAILNESVSLNLENSIIPMNSWDFLIMLDGHPKTIITVRLSNGKWKPVGGGPSGFAEILDDFMHKWPKSHGYNYRYVKILQGECSFMEVFQHEKSIGIVPDELLMEYLTGKTQYDSAKLVDLQTVLPILRKSVKENIDMHSGRKPRKIQ